MDEEQSSILVDFASNDDTQRRDQLEERLPEGLFEGTNPGFGDAVGAALEQGLTRTILNLDEEARARSVGPRVDPMELVRSSPNLTQRFDRLPTEYKERLGEARTEAELNTMLLNAERQLHYQSVLQNAGGLTSIGAQIAAGFLDPTEVGIGILTGGVGAAALRARTVGRGVRAAVTALEAGTANAAITAGIAEGNPTISTEEILASFVTGAALGAPFGFLSRADNVRIADSTSNFARTVNASPDGPFDIAGYMQRNRARESGGNDVAAASTSSAYGRYQFTQSTWLSMYRKTFGDTGESRAEILAKRANGDTQDRVMNTLVREQIAVLRRNEMPVNDTTLYLMHFLGDGDAVRVLRAGGSTPIESVVRSASRQANPSVFRNIRTVDDMVNWAAQKMDSQPVSTGGGSPAAAAQAPQSAASIAAVDEARFQQEGADALDAFTDIPQRDAGSIGAAARGVDDGEYFGTQLTLPGSFARMLSSRVPPEIRQTFGSLISSVPRKDNATRAIAAENTAHRLQSQWLSTAYQNYNPHFRSWAEERGISLLRQELGSNPQQEFMAEVTRAMRGATDVSPQAREAGTALARGYADMLGAAKRAGVEGFEDIAENANYVPRIINERKLMAIYREVGAEGVQRIIRRGLTNAGMEEQLANRVSRAYAEGAVDRATTSGKRAARLRGIADDDVERLRYYLPDDDPSLVDDVISYLKHFRERRNPDGGRTARAKFRLDMDELAEETINGKTYKLTDLYEDDAWALFERYSRTLSGWVGLAERSNIRSDAEWDLMVKGLKDKHKGDPRWAEYEERLDDVKDMILGRPITSENGTLRRTAQSAMKLNFITTMGQAGMASLAELGNVVAYGGLKNMMMHLPAFRGMWRQARTGELDKAFTQELNAMGFGMRMNLGRGRAGLDEWGDPIEQQVFDTVDRILDPFQRTVGYVGLLGPMNDFLQLLAAKSFAQKFASAARGAHKWTDGEILRLRDAGFEDGVLEQAMDSIRKHGTFDGDRIVGLGMDKWHPDIAGDFRDALDRMTYRAVQENDIGSSAWWMHSTMGRMLTQFRSFIGNALVKQTLYMARYRRDPQVWAAFAFTMFFGGLSYTGRSYLNSIGRDDQHDYLEKRIGSVRAVAAGAFNSTGYASILPGSIDTALDITGLDNETGGPLFQMGRTSGLASSFVTGNPTYSLVNNLGGTAKMLTHVPRENYEFSQQDLRRLQGITLMGNVTGIRNMFALLNSELPKKSQEDDYWQ